MSDATLPMFDLTFLTYDHPEANGKTAISGELAYGLSFRLENGSLICIKMGLTSYETFRKFVHQMDIDEQIDKALTNFVVTDTVDKKSEK